MGGTLPSTGMWQGEVFAISDCLVVSCFASLSYVDPLLGSNFKSIRGLPQFAPCLEHICAGGGGGNVAMRYLHVLVLNPDGIVLVRIMLCYLCEHVVLE